MILAASASISAPVCLSAALCDRTEAARDLASPVDLLSCRTCAASRAISSLVSLLFLDMVTPLRPAPPESGGHPLLGATAAGRIRLNPGVSLRSPDSLPARRLPGPARPAVPDRSDPDHPGPRPRPPGSRFRAALRAAAAACRAESCSGHPCPGSYGDPCSRGHC